MQMRNYQGFSNVVLAYIVLLSSQTFAFQAKLVAHNNLLAVAFYADNSVFRGSQELFMSFLYI